jgi:hypothetical protein
MKILVLPRPIAGASTETMQRHADEEVRVIWDLYAQGIVREFYTRTNEPGRVVLVLEVASEETARDALASLPFARLDLIDFDLIPLGSFVGLTRLFAAAR